MDTSWTTVRKLTAQEAEAAAPTVTTGIGAAGPRLEVRLVGGSLGGSPTSFTLTVWRGSGGAIDKIGTMTVLAADVATVIPQLFEFSASACWVTVTFTGGTTPSLTGDIEVRPVFGG